VAETYLLPPRRGPGRGRRCGYSGRSVAAMHATGQGEGTSRGNPCGQPKLNITQLLMDSFRLSAAVSLKFFPYITFLCHIINIPSPAFPSPAAVPLKYFPYTPLQL
jgi:hypothetical protein